MARWIERSGALTLAGALALGAAGYGGEARALAVTAETDPAVLVGNILGPGITVVGTPTFSGGAVQAGTFTGGAGSVGFDAGIVLSSGDVTQIPGANATGPETLGGGGTADDDLSTSVGTSGDADLNALSGFTTYDAAVLSFDFQFGDGTIGGDLYFNFVFASEEYIDFVGSAFNDVFGFFVDGVNIALVPGTADPITVNTINPTANAAYYINNVDNTNGFAVAGLDIKFDGLTTVITASLTGLGPGVHSMKFAVADASDSILDAAVFIEGGTFSSEPPPTGVPAPATPLLLAAGLLGAGALRRRRRPA